MATRLQNSIVVNLSGLVENAIRSVKTIKSRELAIKEAAFQSAVAEGNMSYEAQISWREKQIAEEQKSTIPDAEYLNQLQESVNTTKKLARFDRIRTKYANSLSAYTTGKKSLANHIKTLSTLMSRESSPELLTEMRTEMSALLKTRSENEVAAVTNRANAAQRDLSIPMIDKSIKEVRDRRAKDLLLGNDEAVTAWDETLNSLNTNKSKLTIENQTNEITYRTARNDLKVHQQVELIDQIASSSDATTPFIYNGTSYASQQDYWNRQRDTIINSPDFWSSLKGDIDAETSRIASGSPSGQVPVSRIKEVSDFYNGLKMRPGFENYGARIDQERTAVVDENVNELASFIEQESSVTENYAAAESAAKDLERVFGIKLTRLPGAGEKTFAETTAAAATTIEKQPTARVFTAKETAELKAAEARVSAGIGSSMDKANIDFAKGQGWSSSTAAPAVTAAPTTPAATSPVVQTPTPSTTPQPLSPSTPTPASVPSPTSAVSSTQAAPTNGSITDYLKSKNQDNSFAARTKLAEANGITGYTGTAEQNTALLKKLQGV